MPLTNEMVAQATAGLDQSQIAEALALMERNKDFLHEAEKTLSKEELAAWFTQNIPAKVLES